jgi:N-acetylglucosamine kinase-like BadF-type ATPase
MILIADSGSTKTDWALLTSPDTSFKLLHTQGYNPYIVNSDNIKSSLINELLPSILQPEAVEAIYFYGAGCSTPEKQLIIETALQAVFPKCNTILVTHDLLGSARALLGNSAGFAAILGTGTNTCVYDGTNCVHNIDSLGYLLGDEGSGSYIGKRFLRDFFRGTMPDEVSKVFVQQFNISSSKELLSAIYASPTANRYLASFASFGSVLPSNAYIHFAITECLEDFFNRIVTLYPDYASHSFNCVGSIAINYKQILEEVAGKFGMRIGKLIQSPIHELVTYHQQKG